MRQFVREYVAALSADPETAWPMLTPAFQRESGGLATYREFWDDVGQGRVLEVSADPETLVVSYRVRFENFGTGERPTVLKLAFDDGRYRIAGERTAGT
jgi:eukaryotic-like serine/threonine-protein kinase